MRQSHSGGDTRVGEVSSVHVAYWLTRDSTEDDLRRALALLSADERTRYARFLSAGDRRDFAAAHLLLRRMLSAHGGLPESAWTFVAGVNGKPMLDPAMTHRVDLSFNLAHARGLVSCVVARGADVGIDVERLERPEDVLAIARQYFAPREVADLECCDVSERRVRFIEIWTLKEACVKATGAGITGGLQAFAFVFDGAASLRFHQDDATTAGAWNFALLRLDDYRLAVAVRGADGSDGRAALHVQCFDGERFCAPERLGLLRVSSESFLPAGCDLAPVGAPSPARGDV